MVFDNVVQTDNNHVYQKSEDVRVFVLCKVMLPFIPMLSSKWSYSLFGRRIYLYLKFNILLNLKEVVIRVKLSFAE